jgi:hypothetical protein
MAAYRLKYRDPTTGELKKAQAKQYPVPKETVLQLEAR